MSESEPVKFVYKILSGDQWDTAVQQNFLIGAPIDLEDGFIHFSTASQLPETLKLHFAGQPDLYCLRVQASLLESDLKWEPSRNGELFPHLYGILPVEKVDDVCKLELDENAVHQVADGFLL